MSVSDLAERLLHYHAQMPDQLFYGERLLGTLYPESELQRLDAAYEELAEAGLLEKTRFVHSFFGMPKTLYRITPKGKELATQESAA